MRKDGLNKKIKNCNMTRAVTCHMLAFKKTFSLKKNKYIIQFVQTPIVAEALTGLLTVWGEKSDCNLSKEPQTISVLQMALTLARSRRLMIILPQFPGITGVKMKEGHSYEN